MVGTQLTVHSAVIDGRPTVAAERDSIEIEPELGG